MGLIGWRLRQRRGRIGPAAVGSLYDVLNEDRRRAVENVIQNGVSITASDFVALVIAIRCVSGPDSNATRELRSGHTAGVADFAAELRINTAGAWTRANIIRSNIAISFLPVCCWQCRRVAKSRPSAHHRRSRAAARSGTLARSSIQPTDASIQSTSLPLDVGVAMRFRHRLAPAERAAPGDGGVSGRPATVSGAGRLARAPRSFMNTTARRRSSALLRQLIEQRHVKLA